MLDFEQAGKVSVQDLFILKIISLGLKEPLQVVIDKHTSEFGYEEVIPPNMVRMLLHVELANCQNFLRIYLKLIQIIGSSLHRGSSH